MPIVIDPLASNMDDIAKIIAYVESIDCDEKSTFHCFTSGQCEMLEAMGYEAELLRLNWPIESRSKLFFEFRRDLNKAEGCVAELSGPSPGSRFQVNVANVARGASINNAHFFLAKGFEQFLRKSKNLRFLARSEDNHKIAIKLLKIMSPESPSINLSGSLNAMKQRKKQEKKYSIFSVFRACLIALFYKFTSREVALVFGKRKKNYPIERVPHIESIVYRILQIIYSRRSRGCFELLAWEKLPVCDTLPFFARAAVDAYEEVLKEKVMAQMPSLYGGHRALKKISPNFILTPKTNNFDGEVFRSWCADKKNSRLILFQHGFNADLARMYPRKIEADTFLGWLSLPGGGISSDINRSVEVAHVGHNNGQKLKHSWRPNDVFENDDFNRLNVLYAPTSKGLLFLDVEEIRHRELLEVISTHVASVRTRLHPKSFLREQMKQWILKIDNPQVSFEYMNNNIDWSEYDVLVTTYSTLALEAIRNNVPVVEYDWCDDYYPVDEWLQTVLLAKTEADVLSHLIELGSTKVRNEQVYRQLIHYNKYWA